ncbi:MAG TPA: M23 family metallopeptidase [Thermoleophilaceae bacterium]|nr:M23 family metallopeptidase [Thermoleophilaceae bacterium]
MITVRRHIRGATLLALATAFPAAGLAIAEPASAPSAPVSTEAARLTRAAAAQAKAAQSKVTPPPAAKLVFPIRGRVGYGETAARFGADRGGRRHEGQDIFAPAGTPLLALSDSVVTETGNNGGRGNYIALFSPRRRQTYVYLHMSEPTRLRPGNRARAGQRIGSVGCTGSCWGDHLHLEVRAGRGTQGRPLDPLPLLRRAR